METEIIKNGAIIINPYAHSGWAEKAKIMNQEGDDQLLIHGFPRTFDNDEWTWDEI